MTPRRLDILKFVAKFIDHAGCSPTLAQIADGVSLSRVSVLEHINRLCKDGYLTRQAGEARSIRLTDIGLAAAHGEPSITLPILTAKSLVESCRKALPNCSGDVAQFIRDTLDQLQPDELELMGVAC